MKKISSLTSPSDFRKVFQSGLTISNKYVIMRYLPRSDAEDNRVAFVAGKRIGTAVARNRAKRLLREAYRKNRDKIVTGYDIVIIAKSGLRNRTYWEAEEGFLSALMASGLIKKES